MKIVYTNPSSVFDNCMAETVLLKVILSSIASFTFFTSTCDDHMVSRCLLSAEHISYLVYHSIKYAGVCAAEKNL
jgi:hypothetical protein